MAECVWSRVKCLKKDREVFEDMGYTYEEDAGGLWVDLVDEAANYGHYQDLLDLKGRGIPFVAWSDSKAGVFSAMLFVCDGTEVLEQVSDDDERVTVVVVELEDRTIGVPPGELAYARKVVRRRAEVLDFLGMEKR